MFSLSTKKQEHSTFPVQRHLFMFTIATAHLLLPLFNSIDWSHPCSSQLTLHMLHQHPPPPLPGTSALANNNSKWYCFSILHTRAPVWWALEHIWERHRACLALQLVQGRNHDREEGRICEPGPCTESFSNVHVVRCNVTMKTDEWSALLDSEKHLTFYIATRTGAKAGYQLCIHWLFAIFGGLSEGA